MLLRVADGAVHLQGDAGGLVGGVGAGDLGGRYIPAGGGRTVGKCQGCRVEQGASEFEADRGVGEMVLDGLERADRAPELGPLSRVAHTSLQQGTTRAEQLG